jgi:hypothetical protein
MIVNASSPESDVFRGARECDISSDAIKLSFYNQRLKNEEVGYEEVKFMIIIKNS